DDVVLAHLLHAVPQRGRVREGFAAELLGELYRPGARAERAALRASLLLRVAARVEVNPAVASVRRELFVGNANLAQQALERVLAARRERNARDVPLALVPRKARQVGIGEHRLGAGGNVGDRDLTPPLADLDDERHVLPRRHALEPEPTIRVRERRGDRVARQRHVATIARRAILDGVERTVRHVDARVVERNGAGRIVDHAAHRSGAAVRTRLDVALDPAAERPGRAHVRDPHPPADVSVGALPAIDGAATAVPDLTAVAPPRLGRAGNRLTARGIPAHVRNAATAARLRRGALATVDRAATAVADFSAKLAAHRFAGQRNTAGRGAHAARARLPRWALAAVQRAAATVADEPAVATAFGRARQPNATRPADADPIFTRGIPLALATVELAATAVSDDPAVAAAGRRAAHLLARAALFSRGGRRRDHGPWGRRLRWRRRGRAAQSAGRVVGTSGRRAAGRHGNLDEHPRALAARAPDQRKRERPRRRKAPSMRPFVTGPRKHSRHDAITAHDRHAP